MKPDRCGAGRPLDSLPDGDRQAVEEFQRFLSGELAYAADRETLVPADSPDAVHFAGRPEEQPVRCYISGPITGRPDNNRAGFADGVAWVRARGWEPHNPQDVDPTHDGPCPPGLPADDHTYGCWMRRAVQMQLGCDAVVFLPDWQESRGARIERDLAAACGMTVYEMEPAEGVRSMTPELVDAVVALGRLALDFGKVDRITYHQDGTTPESDTTHTVMLGLIACALVPHVDPTLDVGKVAQLTSIHDVVEVYARDTPTLRVLSSDAKASKDAREYAAFLRIVDEYAATLPWLPGTIREYEQRRTREARYVKALDKLLPKITHLSNDLATIREQGMGYDELAARYDVQVDELKAYAADFPALFDLRADLVGRVLALYRRIGAVA